MIQSLDGLPENNLHFLFDMIQRFMKPIEIGENSNEISDIVRNSVRRIGSLEGQDLIEAVDCGEFGNYWSRTETYESIMTYIAMDFKGLRQLIVDMLGGQRCIVDVDSFQNDITSFNSADDVITLLIHMGYLAYDSKTNEVFIPNEEVWSVYIRAIKNDGWNEVIKAVNASSN